MSATAVANAIEATCWPPVVVISCRYAYIGYRVATYGLISKSIECCYFFGVALCFVSWLYSIINLHDTFCRPQSHGQSCITYVYRSPHNDDITLFRGFFRFDILMIAIWKAWILKVESLILVKSRTMKYISQNNTFLLIIYRFLYISLYYEEISKFIIGEFKAWLSFTFVWLTTVDRQTMMGSIVQGIWK